MSFSPPHEHNTARVEYSHSSVSFFRGKMESSIYLCLDRTLSRSIDEISIFCILVNRLRWKVINVPKRYQPVGIRGYSLFVFINALALIFANTPLMSQYVTATRR